MIELRGLRVAYGGRVALHDLSLRIPEGTVGLLGPNGSGKSTLIRTLLGNLRPAAGGGTVLGRDFTRERLDVRQRVGYMPERDCLFPGLTGVAAVAYAGRLAGMPSGAARQRAHEMLDYVGIGEERYRSAESYSAGMLQRVKFAQAIVHDPELLFLDEPTNGMDPRGRREMLDLIADISSVQGIHVLLSSHLLPDVEAVCRDVVVLAEGRVQAQGNIEEMRSSTSEGWILRIRGDRSPFERAVVSAGGRIEDRERGELLAVLPRGSDVDVLWRAARDAGTQLRRVVPSRRTLEDVFLAALEAGAGTGAGTSAGACASAIGGEAD